MKTMYDSNETMRLIGNQYAYTLIEPNGIARTDFENIFKAHGLQGHGQPFNIALDAFTLGYLYGKRAERARKQGKQ